MSNRDFNSEWASGYWDYMRSAPEASRYGTIAAFVRSASARRILDVGCGEGELLAHLPENIRYVGYDISPEAIKKARSRFWQRKALFLVGVMDGIDDPRIARTSFDLIVFNVILYLAKDKTAIVRDHARLLSEGGHIIISTFSSMKRGGPYVAQLVEKDLNEPRKLPAHAENIHPFWPGFFTELEQDFEPLAFTTLFNWHVQPSKFPVRHIRLYRKRRSAVQAPNAVPSCLDPSKDKALLQALDDVRTLGYPARVDSVHRNRNFSATLMAGDERLFLKIVNDWSLTCERVMAGITGRAFCTPRAIAHGRSWLLQEYIDGTGAEREPERALLAIHAISESMDAVPVRKDLPVRKLNIPSIHTWLAKEGYIDILRELESSAHLHSMEQGEHLLHGDFRIENILLGAERPYLVDWENIARGDRNIDYGDMVYTLLKYSMNAASQFLERLASQPLFNPGLCFLAVAHRCQRHQKSHHYDPQRLSTAFELLLPYMKVSGNDRELSSKDCLRRMYQEGSIAYAFATEDLSAVCSRINAKDKHVFTILGSGDQAINFALQGATSIDAIDISPMSLLFFEVKKALLQTLPRRRFIDAILHPQEEVFASVRDCMPTDAASLLDQQVLVSSSILNKTGDRAAVIRINPYLQSDKAYHKARSSLDRISCKKMSIIGATPTRPAGLIYLSNVPTYLTTPLSALRILLLPHLQPDGIIVDYVTKFDQTRQKAQSGESFLQFQETRLNKYTEALRVWSPNRSDFR